MNSLQRQLSLVLFAVALLGWACPSPTAAQSVGAVAGKMEAQYQRQLSAVNTFIVETNHYTSYYEKTTRGGTPTYRSATRLSGDGDESLMSGSFASDEAPSTFYGFDFDQLRKHAQYGGTETIGGAEAHVLTVDNPAAFDPEMDKSATRLTYYIGAKRHLPVRMRMETKAERREGPASTVVVDLKDYRTTGGLTLPHRMEMQLDIAMSEKERQQIQQMMEQLKAMPERQRKQMERVMGDRMGMITKMVSSEPVVVEVRSVEVNVPLPEDIFGSRSSFPDRSPQEGAASSGPESPSAASFTEESNRESSSTQEAFAAAFPTQIEGISRVSLDVREPFPGESFIKEISAAYDTGPAMPYLVTVTSFEEESPALARLRDSYATSDPAAFTIDGHGVYKRAYEGMGSGVAVFLDGSLPVVVQVRSPRLTEEDRRTARPEQHSDAPAPEAALYQMNLSALASMPALN